MVLVELNGLNIRRRYFTQEGNPAMLLSFNSQLNVVTGTNEVTPCFFEIKPQLVIKHMVRITAGFQRSEAFI